MGERQESVAALSLEEQFAASQAVLAPESRARAAAELLHGLTATQLQGLLVATVQGTASAGGGNSVPAAGILAGLVARAAPNVPAWDDIDLAALLPDPFDPDQQGRFRAPSRHQPQRSLAENCIKQIQNPWSPPQ